MYSQLPNSCFWGSEDSGSNSPHFQALPVLLHSITAAGQHASTYSTQIAADNHAYDFWR